MEAAAVSDWLDAYGRAWEERDPELVVALFSETASYRETPFDEPMRGHAAIRDYWAEIPRSQEDVVFGHELVAADGDRAVARWWSSFTRVGSGERMELDGVFLLRFDDGGRCSELREWWHARSDEGGAA